MAFRTRFNEEKNQLLKATRGISFQEIIKALKDKKILADITNRSKNYPNQRTYIIQLKEYVYVIPYIVHEEKQEIFLKTIYPSRFFTKRYLNPRRPTKNKTMRGKEGGKNEKTKI